jgi:hypothetical protein
MWAALKKYLCWRFQLRSAARGALLRDLPQADGTTSGRPQAQSRTHLTAYLPVYHLTACSGIHCLAVDRVSGVLRAANDALCLRYRLPGVMDNEQELVRLQGCVVL